MRTIITGGSGFIGTNLIAKFKQDGFYVLNLDVKKPINKDYIKYWKKIDITDLLGFKEVVVSFNPDYIVHLAARTDLDGKSLKDYNANTIGVDNLMKVSKEIPSLKKILITSSMLVCKTGYIPKDQFDYSPTTIYGESKVLTEKNVWSSPPLCDWAILRPTSIWGPWFDIPYKTFFDMILAKKYYHIGNKGCTKTYGYVENAIFQIEKILFSDTNSKSNKVFYLGDYNPINIEVWGNEVASELGYSIKKIPFFIIKIAAYFGDILKFFKINFPMTSFRLKNMTTDNIVNLENTKKIAPNLPFERRNAVRKTINWLKSNK